MDWDKLVKEIISGEEALSVQKDAITATSLGIGGALTPAAAQQYFTTVTDQSSFLGQVSSAQVDAIQQDVDLFHIADRQLQRVPEGSEPSTLTGSSNLGKRWALKDVQMFPTVNFSTIVNRQAFGDIDSYLAGMFATVFRNDLLLLGLVGNESSTDNFEKLNDGWVELCRDAVSGSSPDRDLDNVVESTVLQHIKTFKSMLQVMPDKYLTEGKTCFLCSKKNALAWGDEMAEKQGLNPYLITGKVPSFDGFDVIGIPGFPADTFVLTDPKNFGFGMGMTIQRFREIRARKRCIEYTWTLYCDYLVINNEAVVYSDTSA